MLITLSMEINSIKFNNTNKFNQISILLADVSHKGLISGS